MLNICILLIKILLNMHDIKGAEKTELEKREEFVYA